MDYNMCPQMNTFLLDNKTQLKICLIVVTNQLLMKKTTERTVIVEFIYLTVKSTINSSKITLHSEELIESNDWLSFGVKRLHIR